MKRAISILCALLILMVGALTALYLGQPLWFDRLAAHFTGPVVIRTDESFDYVQSDEELTYIVSARFPLEEEYVPDDLVNLYEHKDRSFLLARADIELRQPAYEAAQEMFLAAKADGVEDFIITSGYRTREYQQQLHEESNTGYVNAPSESEHEYGLTFDVTTYTDTGVFEGTAQHEWLVEHCWEYGYVLRYPKDKEPLTGVPYESWHYRFVGKEAAALMHQNNWCLEEYAVYCTK